MKAGEGYRLVDGSESLEAGDELYNYPTKEWRNVGGWWIGHAFSVTGWTVRRRLAEVSMEAGDGYRVVARGEIVQEGDEWYSDVDVEKYWVPTHSPGIVSNGRYRRRVESVTLAPGASSTAASVASQAASQSTISAEEVSKLKARLSEAEAIIRRMTGQETLTVYGPDMSEE